MPPARRIVLAAVMAMSLGLVIAREMLKENRTSLTAGVV